MCVRKSGRITRFNNDPRAKGCERAALLLLLSVILSLFQQAAEHATLLRGQATPWNKNDLGGSGVASLMAVCKSRAFMAYPSTRSQQPSTGCHSSHYTLQPQQETQPDRPIGYGAFGVVWQVFRSSNSWFYLSHFEPLFYPFFLFIRAFRSVTDPRNGKRVALKKMPNVFQSLTSSKRAYRELKMLCFFKHNNVSSNFVMVFSM